MSFQGKRGEQPCTLTIGQLYKLYVDRAQWIRPGTDIEAAAQAFCCEIEKAMEIYPNVPGLKPEESPPQSFGGREFTNLWQR